MKNVTVYSTPACPWCSRAKDFLREKGIDFRDVDVSQDREAAIDMVNRSGQMGVPVIEVDGKMIVGFDVAALTQALGI